MGNDVRDDVGNDVRSDIRNDIKKLRTIYPFHQGIVWEMTYLKVCFNNLMKFDPILDLILDLTTTLNIDLNIALKFNSINVFNL